MDGWIVVPNWDKFQHYKDRDPIWIRTYTRLLADEDYLALTEHRALVIHRLWLEYASSGCRLRADTANLSRRLSLRVTVKDLEALNHAGFLEFSGSKPLSLTRSREQKTNRKNVLSSTAVSRPDTPTAAARKQTAETNGIPDELLVQIAQLGGADSRTPAVLGSFIDRGLPEAAFRNALEATREAHAQNRMRGKPISYLVGTLRRLEKTGQYP